MMTTSWKSLETSCRAPQTHAATMAGRVPAAAAQAPCAAAGGGGSATCFRRWRQHCCAWQGGGAGRPRGSSGSSDTACTSSRAVPWRARATPRARRSAAAEAAPSGGPGGQQAETLADVMNSILAQLAEMQGQQAGGGQRPSGAHLHVSGLGFQPPGERGTGMVRRAPFCCLGSAVCTFIKLGGGAGAAGSRGAAECAPQGQAGRGCMR